MPFGLKTINFDEEIGYINKVENLAIFPKQNQNSGKNKIHMNFEQMHNNILDTTKIDFSWEIDWDTNLGYPTRNVTEVQKFVKKHHLSVRYHSFLEKLSSFEERADLSRHPIGTIRENLNPVPQEKFYQNNNDDNTDKYNKEMDEKRLFGTWAGSHMMYLHGQILQTWPFCWSRQVHEKLIKNGGEFTQSEFESLPEFGKYEHFPFCANDTIWGGDRCYHMAGHGWIPKYTIGDVRFTAQCRGTDHKNLRYLGWVEKIKDPASSNNNILALRALENFEQYPVRTEQEFMSQEGKYWPDYLYTWELFLKFIAWHGSYGHKIHTSDGRKYFDLQFYDMVLQDFWSPVILMIENATEVTSMEQMFAKEMKIANLRHNSEWENPQKLKFLVLLAIIYVLLKPKDPSEI